jgi:hypothetical protein
MGRLMRERLGTEVNIPPPEEVQYIAALGAAVLAQRRLKARAEQRLADTAGAHSVQAGS